MAGRYSTPNNTYTDEYGTVDFNSIAGEPWDTASGGNIDFRVPYVGYNFNAAALQVSRHLCLRCPAGPCREAALA